MSELARSSRPPPHRPMLLDAKAAAAALAISARTLWSLTSCGVIPCVHIGRAVRYDVADLQRFIESAKSKHSGSEPFPRGDVEP